MHGQVIDCEDEILFLQYRTKIGRQSIIWTFSSDDISD